MKVSIINGFNIVADNVELIEALRGIKCGLHYRTVKRIRCIFFHKGKESADRCKKANLPGITFGGTFVKTRSKENIERFNPINVLDYDNIHPLDLPLIKQKACECKYTLAAFISPKGNGLKILVRSDNSIEQYDQAYSQVAGFYDQILGSECDYTGGYGYERLCFYSYDPDLYYNSKAEIFKIII